MLVASINVTVYSNKSWFGMSTPHCGYFLERGKRTYSKPQIVTIRKHRKKCFTFHHQVWLTFICIKKTSFLLKVNINSLAIKKIFASISGAADVKRSDSCSTLLTHHGIQLSLCSILRSQEQLGWTFRGSAYCQLIRDASKVKHLDWAKTYI